MLFVQKIARRCKFSNNYSNNDDYIDKQGKEIANKLEKSIQKAIDRKK